MEVIKDVIAFQDFDGRRRPHSAGSHVIEGTVGEVAEDDAISRRRKTRNHHRNRPAAVGPRSHRSHRRNHSTNYSRRRSRHHLARILAIPVPEQVDLIVRPVPAAAISDRVTRHRAAHDVGCHRCKAGQRIAGDIHIAHRSLIHLPIAAVCRSVADLHEVVGAIRPRAVDVLDLRFIDSKDVHARGRVLVRVDSEVPQQQPAQVSVDRVGVIDDRVRDCTALRDDRLFLARALNR